MKGRVEFPLFELAANPTVHLGDVKSRRGIVPCPVCREAVRDVLTHALDIGDDVHAALSVVES